MHIHMHAYRHFQSYMHTYIQSCIEKIYRPICMHTYARTVYIYIYIYIYGNVRHLYVHIRHRKPKVTFMLYMRWNFWQVKTLNNVTALLIGIPTYTSVERLVVYKTSMYLHIYSALKSTIFVKWTYQPMDTQIVPFMNAVSITWVQQCAKSLFLLS
jgi:hypothetical protein